VSEDTGLPPGSFEERRAHPRFTIDAPGRLFYGPGLGMWADCLIKDISQGGAKLRVDEVFDLPLRLVLLHFNENAVFEARRRWRRWDTVGLMFERRHELETLTDPKLAGVRQVWETLKPGLGGG
jgi:hypothetical protein